VKDSIRYLDRRFYPNFRDNWDNLIFREKVLSQLASGNHLLDLGAGAGILEEMNFRKIAARVCGVDPDPRILGNPYLDEAKLGSAESIPYPNGTFDAVVANNVLEHLPDPQRVFTEVHRVLRPGGLFMAKTPNRRHYVSFASRLTPHRFHLFYNRVRGRAEQDTYPTFYRVNTTREIRYYAGTAGFRSVEVLPLEGRPEYLRISPWSYLPGILYERLVNRFEFLGAFRVILIACMEK